MTTPPFHHDWEKKLHQQLRNLPDMEAPASLIPNVMAAIRKREAAVRAWYRRPATTWPPALQIALGVAALLVFLLGVHGVHQLTAEASIAANNGPLEAFSAQLLKVWSLIKAVGVTASAIFRVAIGPVLIIVAAAACAAYLALLGLGSVVWRSFLRRQATSS